MRLEDIKYSFIYFWPNFYSNKDIFNEKDMKKTLLPFLTDEQKTQYISDANLIICSCFDGFSDDKIKKLKTENPNRIIIFFTGEPHIYGRDSTVTDMILGSDTNDNKNNYYAYLGLLYLRLIREKYRHLSLPITNINPTKFCCIVCTLLDKERKIIYENLNNLVKVDGFGRAFRKPIRSQYWDYEYLKFLAQYKFMITAENTNRQGYNTEKAINPILAGIIPIYWGSDTIFKFVNRERIIYINDDLSNLHTAIAQILFLDKNPDEYAKVISQQPFLKPLSEIESLEGSFTSLSQVIQNYIQVK